jgi:hypothetical protein
MLILELASPIPPHLARNPPTGIPPLHIPSDLIQSFASIRQSSRAVYVCVRVCVCPPSLLANVTRARGRMRVCCCPTTVFGVDNTQLGASCPAVTSSHIDTTNVFDRSYSCYDHAPGVLGPSKLSTSAALPPQSGKYADSFKPCTGRPPNGISLLDDLQLGRTTCWFDVGFDMG